MNPMYDAFRTMSIVEEVKGEEEKEEEEDNNSQKENYFVKDIHKDNTLKSVSVATAVTTIHSITVEEKERNIPTNIQGSEVFIKLQRELCMKYNSVFSKELRTEPAKVTPMEIRVADGWYSRENSKPPRVQSTLKDEEIKRQVEEMTEKGVIQHSEANQYSQVLLTPKSNGSWRFCIDYRRLNAVSKPDNWPIPNIRDVLNRLGEKKATYFGVLDLTKGYYQAPMSAQSKHFTSFMTKVGLYEWNRVAMGLTGAPGYFQKVMATEVLKSLMYHSCEVYLDDIIIWGIDEEEFINNLEKLLQRLQLYNITVNPDKCNLGKKEIEYVGHTINKEGKHFTREKLQKVLQFPPPKTFKEMRSFLGLVNYFRDHVEKQSDMVAPLYKAIENYSSKRWLKWTPAVTAAYEKVQKAINECPQLFFMNMYDQVKLYTDASDIGIGGYLCQVRDIKEYPVAFISKTFSTVQRRWSVPEREGYAVFYCIMKLQYLLRDIEFELYTDHDNLTYIRDSGSPKVIRWKLELQEFRFSWIHIKGRENNVADYLSRNEEAEEDSTVFIIEGSINIMMTAEAVVKFLSNDQSKDIEVIELKDHLLGEEEEADGDEEDEEDIYNINVQVMNEIIIPNEQYDIIKKCHNCIAGHHGLENTIVKILKNNTAWSQMRMHVQKFIKECDSCQKSNVIDKRLLTKPFVTGMYQPFERINIDTIGPLPEDEGGYRYIFTIIDCFSRYLTVYPSINISAEEAAEAILIHMSNYGTPCQILSDRGSEYVNKVIKELLDNTGVDQILTIAYSKEENSIVERANKEVNRWIKDILYGIQIPMKEWKKTLPFVQRLHNASVIKSIGCTPADIIFGKSVNLDRGIIIPMEMRSKDDTDQKLEEWVENKIELQDIIMKTARRLQHEHEEKHVEENPIVTEEFEKDSFVLVSYPNTTYGQRRPNKISMYHTGPYKVIGHEGNLYELENLVTGKIIQKNIHLLRRYYYDKARTDPNTIALKDYVDMYIVERIINHQGKSNRRSSLSFEVKWEGYEETSWEPYNKLRDNQYLHNYLKENKMQQHIPKRYKNDNNNNSNNEDVTNNNNYNDGNNNEDNNDNNNNNDNDYER